MKAVIEFSLIPIGAGVSLSKYVAACEQILSEAGLKSELHANGTNVEGDWDAIMSAIKRCHKLVHEMGAPRISTLVKISTRTDREESLQQKVRSVEELMETKGR